ncbi:hypothetical protein ACFSKS_14095 [Pseudocitrobacter faecalis]
MTKQIKLGAFLPGGGQHIAAWRHPDQPADGATSFEFHKQLAQTAERGLFDAYFLADGLAAPPLAEPKAAAPKWLVLNPSPYSAPSPR